jgi:hypothetical protein
MHWNRSVSSSCRCLQVNLRGLNLPCSMQVGTTEHNTGAVHLTRECRQKSLKADVSMCLWLLNCCQPHSDPRSKMMLHCNRVGRQNLHYAWLCKCSNHLWTEHTSGCCILRASHPLVLACADHELKLICSQGYRLYI